MKKLLILGAGTAGTNLHSELVSESFSKTFEMLKRVQHEN